MIGITITSNRSKWIQQANDTASVFRRGDVQSEVRRDLAREVRKLNKAQFDGQGIGASGKWKKLKPATIKKKGHKRILYDTGHLYRQATRGGHIQAGYSNALKLFNFSYTINTSPQGLLRWHQRGTKKMPRRPIFDPNERQQARLTAQVFDAVERAWRKIGWFDKMYHSRAPFVGFDQVDVNG